MVELVALGTAMLLTLAPLGRADDPVQSNRGGGTNQRPAAERWKRLKSQYHYQPPMVTRSTQPQQVSPPAPTNVPVDSFRPIQEKAETASDNPARTALPELSTSPRSIPTTSDAEFDPFDEIVAPGKPSSELPMIPAADDPESNLSPPKLPNLAERLDPQTSGAREISEPLREVPQPENSDVSANPKQPGDIPYEAGDNVKSPLEATVPNRGTPRPAVPTVPSGPPRKTTEVRPMSQIAPMNDDELDRDIREYATKMSREWNIQFGGEKYPERQFPDVVMPWSAPSSQYYPLYFQDPALERYGHTYSPLVQPVVSSARMSAQLVMLPYQMAIRPPWQLTSPLGWYRPGEVTPKLHYQIPLNAKAAAVEAATVTGLIFLIP